MARSRAMGACLGAAAATIVVFLAYRHLPWRWEPLPTARPAFVASPVAGRRVAVFRRPAYDGRPPFPEAIRPSGLPPAAYLEEDSLVVADLELTWSDGASCTVEAVEDGSAEGSGPPHHPVPDGMVSGTFLASADSLRAVDVMALECPTYALPGGLVGRGVVLHPGLGGQDIDLWQVALTDRTQREMVLWRRWWRSPGSAVYVYRVKDNRPDWLFMQIVWPVLWCDPKIVLLPGDGRGWPAEIVVFQPPIWPATYLWDGERFSNVTMSWRSMRALPGVLLWSLRRWVIILGVALFAVVAVRLVRRVLRRRGDERANQDT